MKQLLWLILSLPVLFCAVVIPYRRYRDISYPLFILSLMLLVLVFFMKPINGARRWIPLGILNFQPSELAKLGYILALSHYLMFRSNYRTLRGLLVPFVLTLIPVLLILREPDLGTSLLFVPVLYAMLFTAGARLRHLLFITFLGAISLPILWGNMSAEQKSRVVILFTQKDSGPAPRGDGYHLHQSKRMIVAGGIWGNSREQTPVDDPDILHLPAARTDFIFCLIAERWGMMGLPVHALALFTVAGSRIEDRVVYSGTIRQTPSDWCPGSDLLTNADQYVDDSRTDAHYRNDFTFGKLWRFKFAGHFFRSGTGDQCRTSTRI